MRLSTGTEKEESSANMNFLSDYSQKMLYIVVEK